MASNVDHVFRDQLHGPKIITAPAWRDDLWKSLLFGLCRELREANIVHAAGPPGVGERINLLLPLLRCLPFISKSYLAKPSFVGALAGLASNLFLKPFSEKEPFYKPRTSRPQLSAAEATLLDPRRSQQSDIDGRRIQQFTGSGAALRWVEPSDAIETVQTECVDVHARLGGRGQRRRCVC